jgi:hypothetical protein
MVNVPQQSTGTVGVYGLFKESPKRMESMGAEETLMMMMMMMMCVPCLKKKERKRCSF